ncbi:B12-binding domain-containing radical SAM protein [Patescibacteria group bacterium]
MIDIVLFYPKLETVKPRLLPMGVLSIAGPLVEAGFNVKIIDQRVDNDWRNTLLNSLNKKPLLVGFSVMTGIQILNALEATKLVKKNSNILTVWGGVHPSLLPEQTLENSNIDFAVVGEGENILLNLVKSLKSNQSYKDIPGLGYKEGNEIVVNPAMAFIDLDTLPDIPYHLVDIEKYIQEYSYASGKKARSIDFYTSRGCPHRCAFCYNQEFNKRKWRGNSAQKVVEQIKKLIDNYQISALDIEDDEFFVDMKRAKEICELLIKENINIEIMTTCRVNYVSQRMDGELLNLCKKAGFNALSFGVESGSSKIQKMMSKDITTEQVFDTIKKLKKADIGSKYFFMAGIPREQIEDLYATTDLIRQMKELDNGVRIPAWRVFTPYPGTELYGKSIELGFNPPKNLENWAKYDFKTINMPWVSKKAKKIIKNVIYSIKFLELEKESSNSFYFNLSRLYGKTVDYRWRKHWFFFPEKNIILLFLKIKSFLTK